MCGAVDPHPQISCCEVAIRTSNINRKYTCKYISPAGVCGGRKTIAPLSHPFFALVYSPPPPYMLPFILRRVLYYDVADS